MAIYNRQNKFTKEQLLGHYLTRNSIIDVIYCFIRVLCIVIQNLYCISSYLVLSWLVLLPISWFRNDLYSRLENYLYNSLLFIVSSWSLAAGVTIVESGDEYKNLIEETDEFKLSEKGSGDFEDSDNSNYLTVNGNKNSHSNYSSRRLLDDMLDCNQKKQNGCAASACNGMNRIKQLPTYVTFNDGLGNKFSSRDSRCQNIETKRITNLNNNYHLTGDHLQDDGLLNQSVGMGTINNNNNISENNHKTARHNSHLNGFNVPKPNLNDLILRSPVNNSQYEPLRLKRIQQRPRILFLCNHISTADVPLIMQSFSTLTNQSILWVLDAQFKFTNFGVVCGSHGDFFVAKNSFIDGSLREHVLKHEDRNLLVLFPEGGFLRKRIEGSNRYAVKNNLPLTKYVTHPRFGAFKDLIDSSVGVTHIVDATLMYDDIRNPLSIIDIVFGYRKQPAILNYKVYKRSEINPTEEWLRSIWLEKDKLLTRFYEDRESVLKKLENSFRVAVLDWFKILSVHLFYLLVCYLAIFKLFNATSVTMLKARELYYSNI